MIVGVSICDICHRADCVLEFIAMLNSLRRAIVDDDIIDMLNGLKRKVIYDDGIDPVDVCVFDVLRP